MSFVLVIPYGFWSSCTRRLLLRSTGNHNGSSSSTGKSILASNFDNNDTSEIDSQSIDQCVGQFLTYDHKPNQPKELRRIEAAGGSLTYLHGGKPFIRGGDFTQRQKKGDRPMQLNYSRAFGAKDLKCFGLSCVPDIAQIELDASVKVVVLASDGLWDVCSADQAVRRALVAHKSGMSREKLPHSLTLSHSHLLTSSLTLSHSHILTHLLSHLLTFSPSHILTHLLTHLLTFSLPLSPSHLLTPSLSLTNTFYTGFSPAAVLVDYGLAALAAQGSVDNVTVTVLIFKDTGKLIMSSSSSSSS